ncbi:hypothetical protein PG995_004290 [Apiospora arundinis]
MVFGKSSILAPPVVVFRWGDAYLDTARYESGMIPMGILLKLTINLPDEMSSQMARDTLNPNLEGTFLPGGIELGLRTDTTNHWDRYRILVDHHNFDRVDRAYKQLLFADDQCVSQGFVRLWSDVKSLSAHVFWLKDVPKGVRQHRRRLIRRLRSRKVYEDRRENYHIVLCVEGYISPGRREHWEAYFEAYLGLYFKRDDF